MHLDAVAAILDLPPATVEALGRLQSPSPPENLILPSLAEAEAQLRTCDIDPIDLQETLAARPDPETHPALWWVLQHVAQDQLWHMGQPVPITGFRGYPPLPAATGAVGRYLPIWTYLTLVPHTRQFHQQRGIPAEISEATLGSALGPGLRAHRAATGLGGLGLWGFGWTLPLRMRGVDYQIGRLGFHLGEMSFSSGPCGHLLGVHILAGRPLAPEACDDAFRTARQVFAESFPESPVTFFTCESWLMDPQLQLYLSPASNIIQFQRRFRLVPLSPASQERHQCDDEMRGYVFGRQARQSLNDLPQETSLHRAYTSHLKSGGHWYTRTGWFPFTDPEHDSQEIWGPRVQH